MVLHIFSRVHIRGIQYCNKFNNKIYMLLHHGQTIRAPRRRHHQNFHHPYSSWCCSLCPEVPAVRSWERAAPLKSTLKGCCKNIWECAFRICSTAYWRRGLSGGGWRSSKTSREASIRSKCAKALKAKATILRRLKDFRLNFLRFHSSDQPNLT